MNFDMLGLALLVVIASKSVLTTLPTNDPIIKLPDGQVRGRTYVTPNNITYYGFQGIPFATPPIGRLRFETPQPPKPWNETLNATRDAKGCISTDYWNNRDSESEDCLYINVYTPLTSLEKVTEKLPVLVWIYGGAFNIGSSSKSEYGPDFIIEERVIMVSFNYRLGVFGFLSTGDTVIRGNAGLKDQTLALKWVQKNIEYFGGDPQKVTVFGESAGATSAGLHILSKKSAGLFSGAILQSGSALVYWAINPNVKYLTFLLADALNGEKYKNDTQKLKKFFQDQPFERILNAALSLGLTQLDWPTLEVNDEEAFISEAPYVLLESGRFNRVPIIIGICAEEHRFFLPDFDVAGQQIYLLDVTPIRGLIPKNLRQNPSDDYAVVKAVRSIYLKRGETFSVTPLALLGFFSDNMFNRGVIKHAELASAHVPVYLYQFSYFGRLKGTRIHIENAEEAGHTAELPFLFLDSEYSKYANDLATQNRIVKLWTNFAKFRNPTPEKSELFENITWPIFKPKEMKYLNINRTLDVRNGLKNDSYSAWNRIYDKYGKKPYITY